MCDVIYITAEIISCGADCVFVFGLEAGDERKCLRYNYNLSIV